MGYGDRCGACLSCDYLGILLSPSTCSAWATLTKNAVPSSLQGTWRVLTLPRSPVVQTMHQIVRNLPACRHDQVHELCFARIDAHARTGEREAVALLELWAMQEHAHVRDAEEGRVALPTRRRRKETATTCPSDSYLRRSDDPNLPPRNCRPHQFARVGSVARDAQTLRYFSRSLQGKLDWCCEEHARCVPRAIVAVTTLQAEQQKTHASADAAASPGVLAPLSSIAL